MAARPPEGETPPTDGALPEPALTEFRSGTGPFGAYLHIPFCLRRCGYCDFNTYTPGELGESGVGTPIEVYLEAIHAEIELAGRLVPSRPLDTVFLGGGTPTLLSPSQIGGLLGALEARFGLADGVEVTTEANPDTVDEARIAGLAEAGITRVSLGMQSAVPHVLATLDRTHEQAAVGRAVRAARAHGLATSVDLIYGTPGESLEDWRRSLHEAVALEPDHVSAYALVVEEGTRLAAQVRRGEVQAPDDDDEADKYELADSLLTEAGFAWYEVSNWARTAAGVCRHNEGYWRSGQWWGFGPGAHSHVGGVRWWNVRHPAAYSGRLAAGHSPAQGREVLTAEQRHFEDVLLRIRLAEGLDLARVPRVGADVVTALVEDGLVGPVDPAQAGARLVLTRRGRLLADAVVHRLLG
ncbi:radical SAM family heme chaperone HemW [Mobilicoccus caccae]|uniref:radical SAM family heme chaperone HemW n=1 Tax=Mobilicoccus caccae TaxID=1859295 RepID=UPI0024E0D36E|nr:radical SAM family heme chaperone HemW [Mobilicoccus caccae]